MSGKRETKHERFLRLAQRRLERAKEELRLISQLAKRDYEYYPEEAREVVQILDEDVRHIAEAFEVEYASRIGKAASKTTGGARALGLKPQRASILDEIEVLKIMDLLRSSKPRDFEKPGDFEKAMDALRSALTGGQRAA